MNLQQKINNKLIPKNDNLHVYWYAKEMFGKKVKTFTVVCSCGCNKLLVHENGIRCTDCQGFHSHMAFQEAKMKAERARMMDDGKIEQIPQPYIQKWMLQEAKKKAMGIKTKKPQIITTWN